jgi:hypothetical protein
MVRKPRYKNSKLVIFIKKWTVPWYAITAVLYFLAIPLTAWVLPATTLILSIFVLFGGFTSSMAALASALISAEQDKAMASVEDTVSEEKVVPHDY